MTKKAIDRWMDLMTSQAGMTTDRDGADVTLRPRTTLTPTEGFDADGFELRVQIPTEASYTLTVCGLKTDCKCTESRSTQDACYVDTVSPIKVLVVPGEVVSVQLDATWVDKRKAPCSQRLVDGEFVVPSTMDTMGSPGYQVHVPHLNSLAYFSVGNVVLNGTTEPRLMFLSFNLVLLTA